MGQIVFQNSELEKWLTKKSDEILLRATQGALTSEDISVLCLKGLKQEIRQTNEKMDLGFQRIDKRLDTLTQMMMWQGGMTLTLFTAIIFHLLTK